MSPAEAVSFVKAALAERADPEKAIGMQAYMKTYMPFYGVQKPGRTEIMRHLKQEFAPGHPGRIRSAGAGPLGASPP